MNYLWESIFIAVTQDGGLIEKVRHINMDFQSIKIIE